MTLRMMPFALLALAACAGSKTLAKCDPVPESFQTGGAVYAECAVDTKAQPSGVSPRIDYRPRVTGTSACWAAVIDVVAAADGRVLTSTAKVVRSTDTGFTEAVLASLTTVRYKPAMKDGVAVSQLVRVERKGGYVVTVAAAGTTPQRPVSPPQC